MNWLPRQTDLGRLTLDDTFVFYDGPRVFTARSTTDQIFLAGWAEEGEHADLWLYVPISQARLNLVRSGGVTLRSAYLNPEGYLYLVSLPDDESEQDDARKIETDQVQESWLPAADYRLNISTHTVPEAASASEITRLVFSENRTRLRIKLDHNEMFRTEAPSRQVGEILILTQKLLDNVGFALDADEVSKIGRIPTEVIKQTASDVVGLRAASFVMELAASSFDDLLGDSLFANSTKTILELLDPELRSESISTGLLALGPRPAKSFRRFVKGLADSGADVQLAAAGTNFKYINRELPTERLELLMTILNRIVPDDDVTEIRERMELFAYDSERGTFGLQTRDGIRYEGKVESRAQASHPTIDNRYDVVILATQVLDEVVGEIKVTYALSQLIPAAEEEPPH
ncbi:DUF6575 domain-containing protein [Rhodococcus sp. Leaf233]|uniref:DUF6575 domain-containing protein n=1 Tax=Rhodococcus sp. Leaf233 TaxID=1736302 RepID=UPI00070EFB76|nr:DUF6575 domain-containing protein [Rhodococcus sp. Leaf233]KQU34215.1 hypothetical protein ASH04_25765 [Rhodococcus sp. Leaf233]